MQRPVPLGGWIALTCFQKLGGSQPGRGMLFKIQAVQWVPRELAVLPQDVSFSAISKGAKLVQFGVNSKPEGKVLPVTWTVGGLLRGPCDGV